MVALCDSDTTVWTGLVECLIQTSVIPNTVNLKLITRYLLLSDLDSEPRSLLF